MSFLNVLPKYAYNVQGLEHLISTIMGNATQAHLLAVYHVVILFDLFIMQGLERLISTILANATLKTHLCHLAHLACLYCVLTCKAWSA